MAEKGLENSTDVTSHYVRGQFWSSFLLPNLTTSAIAAPLSRTVIVFRVIFLCVGTSWRTKILGNVQNIHKAQNDSKRFKQSYHYK